MTTTTEQQSLPDASDTFHRLSFSGRATEYFGIWIVNILLTIITVGIYSAWAKVRRNRYFYGNTILLGRGFEYHAKGKQILIGRIIVVAYLVIYNVVLAVFPPAGLVLGALILLFIPWLVMRGLRFSARMTSYRNVRFDFAGGVGGAFVAFLLGPLLATITIGILTPLASRWASRYVGNNMRYGGKSFATNPGLGALYGTWLLSLVIFVILLFLLLLAVLGVFLLTNMDVLVHFIDNPNELLTDLPFEMMMALIVLAYVAVGILAIAALFYQAGVRNIAWSATTFDGRHQLKSDMSRFRFTWIAVSNLIVTLLTLGLMRPWAAVRTARYLNEHTAIRFDGNVGEIFSATEKEGSAVGSEFMDLEGFDFGF